MPQGGIDASAGNCPEGIDSPFGNRCLDLPSSLGCYAIWPLQAFPLRAHARAQCCLPARVVPQASAFLAQGHASPPLLLRLSRLAFTNCYCSHSSNLGTCSSIFCCVLHSISSFHHAKISFNVPYKFPLISTLITHHYTLSYHLIPSFNPSFHDPSPILHSFLCILYLNAKTNY